MKTTLLFSLAIAFSIPLHAQIAGRLDPAFHPDIDGSGVLATAVQPDGKILIGGVFTRVNGRNRSYIARLNTDGSLEERTTFNPEIGANGFVLGTGVQADGKIVIGGYFTTRVNADGTVEDTDFGSSDIVYCVAVQADGKVLIGGRFITVNGQPRRSIARFNVDGSLESTATFNPGTGANSTANSVALQADGKILLAGYFTSVDGQPRNRIARLNADGTLESTATFNPGTGPDDFVRSVVVQPDGKILIGGPFTSVNGQPRNGIARLNADGTVESTATFNPGTGVQHTRFGKGDVNSVALQADGRILLGGYFTRVNDQERNGIARLNPNGILEDATTFDAGSGVMTSYSFNGQDILLGGGIASVALQANGKILLGGEFSSVDGQLRNGIARLANDPATKALTAGSSATRVQWDRGGSAPEVGQVSFELSTDGGVSWSPLGIGTRIPGGWELTGLSLPGNGSVRARGRTSGGLGNGSSGVVEEIEAFTNADALIGKFGAGTFVGDGIHNRTGKRQTVTASVGAGNSRVFTVLVHNVGIVTANYTLIGSARTAGFDVQYSEVTDADITAAVVSGTYQINNLLPGTYKELKLTVVVKAGAPIGAVKTCRIDVRPVGATDAAGADTVKARVTVKRTEGGDARPALPFPAIWIVGAVAGLVVFARI